MMTLVTAVNSGWIGLSPFDAFKTNEGLHVLAAAAHCFLEIIFGGQDVPARQVPKCKLHLADEERAAFAEAVHVVLALHIWQRQYGLSKRMYNVEKPNDIHALSTGTRNDH